MMARGIPQAPARAGQPMAGDLRKAKMSATLIESEVALHESGKRQGYLRVPHSSDRSAYGWIGVPITVVAGGEGPTVLLLAGVHGDEYEGQIALGRLASELDAADVQGRLIILNMANAPAAEAGRRVSPIDGGNLNRAFPGRLRGSPTEMIAHYIEHVLMPLADVMVDLHSGGESLFYPPTLLRGMGHDADEAARLRKLQDAFDLPYAWIFTSGGGPGSTAPTALGAANRNGVMGIMAELGGGGGVDREILRLAERGIRRVLHALGVLPGHVPDARRGTRELVSLGIVHARDAGVFEPLKEIAEPVAQGEPLALVHRVDAPWMAPEPVLSPHAGMVLCKRARGQVRRGDALFQIADDLAADRAGR